MLRSNCFNTISWNQSTRAGLSPRDFRQTLAATLSGNDPVGKIVKFDDRDLLTVVSVFESFPANSW
jgi:hypothetical protein